MAETAFVTQVVNGFTGSAIVLPGFPPLPTSTANSKSDTRAGSALRAQARMAAGRSFFTSLSLAMR